MVSEKKLNAFKHKMLEAGGVTSAKELSAFSKEMVETAVAEYESAKAAYTTAYDKAFAIALKEAYREIVEYDWEPDYDDDVEAYDKSTAKRAWKEAPKDAAANIKAALKDRKHLDPWSKLGPFIEELAQADSLLKEKAKDLSRIVSASSGSHRYSHSSPGQRLSQADSKSYRSFFFQPIESREDLGGRVKSIFVAPIALTLLAIENLLESIVHAIRSIGSLPNKNEAKERIQVAGDTFVKGWKMLFLAMVSPLLNIVDVIGSRRQYTDKNSEYDSASGPHIDPYQVPDPKTDGKPEIATMMGYQNFWQERFKEHKASYRKELSEMDVHPASGRNWLGYA